ncbi:MAG: UDP-N-acetylglucosamine 2-epimerase [Candidatus Fischerbacteria bacterium RBG_13_37_8]|uniref:UDP-N-acetylglucosamine 2-epimerase n=1 Tax=Candidatus Fischerbacteria bacterium RBG_13_37_8 TaxID=1817863 RepID=A0A1F5VY49_9BACT|nr:MAG: UDP-N-acetylglucosamine 2-epimerase [Candidatus Fischerbacteria bacterium RBG_13_37_8]
MKKKTNHLKKLLLVGGARPNFMKIAPIIHAIKKRISSIHKKTSFDYKIIHTGQHYDYEMSKVFFEELEIPEPDYFLNAGSGSHAQQTARIMIKFETVCLKEKPDLVIVVGDVNSTLACSLTAKKLAIKIAHIEAGLRSRDKSMPEEINRIITDAISDFLFVTEKSAIDNLIREGCDSNKIFFVGNVMIDTLLYQLNKLEQQNITSSSKYKGVDYAVVTLHRPSNVDDKKKFKQILESLTVIAKDMTILFPVHPRTMQNIKIFGFLEYINSNNIELLSPLPYNEFLLLVKNAQLVLTDSGGIQEETTVLGIPCFTIRKNTERPVTLQLGTNKLVGTNKAAIIKAYKEYKKNSITGKIPELWDGKTADRILAILLKK